MSEFPNYARICEIHGGFGSSGTKKHIKILQIDWNKIILVERLPLFTLGINIDSQLY